MGIMHKRINAQGAYVTLISGFIIGFGRIFLEIMSDSLNPGSFLYIVGTMNYLSFGSWFFFLCLLLITAVSLATEEPKSEKVLNLTLGTVSSEEKKITKASFDWKDVSTSIFVVLVVVFVMLWFNGR
jgi:SSS family solute:Na+ symporter